MDKPSAGSLRNQSSIIKGLFRSCISPCDIDVIYEYLNAGEQELKSFEVEINKFRASILSLEKKRDRLKNRMARYRSLLSPIYRLPDEMLGNIFNHTCDTAHELFFLGEAPGILNLSSVCGRWREITLSMPSLWANIYLGLGGHETSNFPRFTRILQLFMDRSKSTPISIELTMRDLQLNPPTIGLLKVLSQSIGRCRSIKLDIPPEIFEHPSLGLLPSRLHSIQHIGFVFPHLIPHHIEPFNQCPSLTSLEFCYAEPPYSFERVWPTIKDLRVLVTRRSVSLIAALLKVCKNVETLDIVATFDSQFETPIVVSPLRSLKVLQVSIGNSLLLHTLFQSLTLTNLSTIKIDGDIDKDHIQHFTDFLSRSNCNITHLELAPSPTSRDHDVLSFLRLLPSLQELCLEELQADQTLFRSFLDQLSVEQGFSFSPPLLPQLTNLTLALHHDSDTFEEELLVRAVTSRWLPSIEDALDVGVACLRSLRLEVEDVRSFPPLKPLLYLRDAGLRVDIFQLQL